METVLVTGGAGFIGSHTCKTLAAHGFLPVAFDDLSRGHADFVRWAHSSRAIFSTSPRSMRRSSDRAITRLTGTSKKAVSRLMVEAGQAAAWYQDRVLRNLNCRRIQVDEIWSFVYAKQKNVATAKAAPANAGDVWTWTAIDADTKLIPSWHIGGRDSDSAIIFMDDLASRLANRVQLTSDGHKAYLEAVEGAFGGDIDYAMLVKLYGENPEAEKRYSPAICIGAQRRW
jgi:NAD(P)-dependent dehydrogenase (short-subunit alcohol dehydrogenase family)